MTIKNITKFEIIIILIINIETLLTIFVRYKTLKEIIIVFYNGSKNTYHFIIRELAEEFKGPFECLGENTEKYINFSVPIKKDFLRKTITYKIKFIDCFRFMSSSLFHLSLSEGLYDKKCTDCKIASNT